MSIQPVRVFQGDVMVGAVTAAAVTIANGQSLSDAVDLMALGPVVGIITDAAWDANTMTFQGSYDGVTYTDLRQMGVEVAVPGVAASSMEALDPLQFLPCKYLKVRSGTAANPVPQTGDTVVTIICRPV